MIALAPMNTSASVDQAQRCSRLRHLSLSESVAARESQERARPRQEPALARLRFQNSLLATPDCEHFHSSTHHNPDQHSVARPSDFPPSSLSPTIAVTERASGVYKVPGSASCW